MAKRRTREQAADFRRQVVSLRTAGLQFDEIAKKLDAPLTTCHTAFKQAMRLVPAGNVKELRAMHNARLEELYGLALGEAKVGNVPAIAQALNALKQIAELNGLNTPTVVKNEHTGKDGGPIQTESHVTAEQLSMLTQAERDQLRGIVVKIAEAQHMRH